MKDKIRPERLCQGTTDDVNCGSVEKNDYKLNLEAEVTNFTLKESNDILKMAGIKYHNTKEHPVPR